MSELRKFLMEPLVGDPFQLKGVLTAFARFENDTGDYQFITVSGDYRKNRTLKDFISSEIENIEGIELEGFIEELRDEDSERPNREEILKRLDALPDMEVIPVPARIEMFQDKAEILQRDGDVFDLGTFSNQGNAQLTVSAFPILYQAFYREQESVMIRKEVDALIQGVEELEMERSPQTFGCFQGDLLQHLLKVWMPRLVDERENRNAFEGVREQFRQFMVDCKFQEELQELLVCVDLLEQSPRHYRKKVTLLLRKLVALESVQEAEVVQINFELAQLNRDS